MATQTTNYNLTKPDYTDPADISVINGNMDKVDTELKKIADGTNPVAKANQLTTARNISLTGDATGTVSFNGTQDANIALTLANSGVGAGTYKSVTVDAKGRVTAGSNPTTLAGYGITDATPSSHIGSNGTSHGVATESVAGFMSSGDKTSLDKLKSTVSANLPATAGWYRIAESELDILTNLGIFKIDFESSSKHGSLTLVAGNTYGYSSSNVLNQLAYTAYSGTEGITKARLVYHTTASGNKAYLEVYNPSATAVALNVAMIQSLGWTLITPTAGSIPSGYTSLELTAVNGLATNGQVMSNVATGTAPLAVSSTTKVPNLNVQYLNGKEDTDFAPSGFGLGGNATRLTVGYDLNLLRANGWYDIQTPTNGVAGLTWMKILMVNSADSGNNYATQLGFSMTESNNMYMRQYTNGTWNNWRRLVGDTDSNVFSGSNSFTEETHFTDTTYTDPWSGTACAIKTTGHVGVGGSLKVTNQLISAVATGTPPLSVASNTVVTNLNADMVDGQDLADLDARYVNLSGDTMGGDLFFDTSTEKKICPANASYRWGFVMNSTKVGIYDWANARNVFHYTASTGEIDSARKINLASGASGIGRISAYSWNGTINNGVSANFTHNLGYKPFVNFSGTRGNIIMTIEHTDLNNFTVTCYSSGGSNFTGYIYAW